MPITLKFVSGAHLSTYVNTTTDKLAQHIILMDRLLRIKSQTKPPATEPKGIDLKPGDLGAVKKVLISAPATKDAAAVCSNVHFGRCGLASLVYDELLSKPEELISIEIKGGKFSYPHRHVEMPNIPGRPQPCGWIQVDFETDLVTIELFSDSGARLNTYEVYDNQACDIAGYTMHKLETGSWDGEKVSLTEEQVPALTGKYPIYREMESVLKGGIMVPESKPYIIFKVLEANNGTTGGNVSN